MAASEITEENVEEVAYASHGALFPPGLAVLDPNLNVFWANERVCKILGYTQAELVGRNLFDVVHADSMDDMVPLMDSVTGREPSPNTPAAESSEVGVRVISADGSWKPVYVTGRVLNEAGFLLGVLRPATERLAVEAVLDGLGSGAGLEEMLHSLLDLLRAHFDVETGWAIHESSDQVVVTGSPADLLPWDPGELMTELRTEPWSGVRTERDIWIARIVTKSDESVHGALAIPSPKPVAPMPMDLHIFQRTTSLAALVFERTNKNLVLQRDAQTDFLTGVTNRREFDERLASCESQPSAFPLAMFFVDIDDFKLVNDRWGHTVGDDVLVAVARRLRRATRPGSTVGRIGGDEFAVLAAGVTADEIEPMRVRFERATSAALELAVGRIQVRTSVGVAVAETEDDLVTLIERSDADMFTRKAGVSRPRLSAQTFVGPTGFGLWPAESLG